MYEEIVNYQQSIRFAEIVRAFVDANYIGGVKKYRLIDNPVLKKLCATDTLQIGILEYIVLCGKEQKPMWNFFKREKTIADVTLKIRALAKPMASKLIDSTADGGITPTVFLAELSAHLISVAKNVTFAVVCGGGDDVIHVQYDADYFAGTIKRTVFTVGFKCEAA